MFNILKVHGVLALSTGTTLSCTYEASVHWVNVLTEDRLSNSSEV